VIETALDEATRPRAVCFSTSPLLFRERTERPKQSPKFDSIWFVDPQNFNRRAANRSQSDEVRAVPFEVSRPVISARVEQRLQTV
jgi:hypothetical protein